MANQLYPKAKEDFISGNIDLTTDTIKIVLVDTADYTFDSAHEDLADVAAGGRVATATLGSKTVTSGVFDAADATFSNVTGDQAEALIIYKDSGVEATSRLIAYIDTATGLPITPGGGDITVAFSDGANKIFAL
jgi:hypothetical protein